MKRCWYLNHFTRIDAQTCACDAASTSLSIDQSRRAELSQASSEQIEHAIRHYGSRRTKENWSGAERFIEILYAELCKRAKRDNL